MKSKWIKLLSSRVFQISVATVVCGILKEVYEIEVSVENLAMILGGIGAIIIYLLFKDRAESQERVAQIESNQENHSS
jgi:uncharacterized membrane protein